MRFHYDEIADEEENETESEHENDHRPNGPTLVPQLGTPLRNEESNPTTVEQAETTEQEEEEEINEEQPQTVAVNDELVTRSGRVSRPPTRFDNYQMHLQTQAHPQDSTCEYAKEEARVIAKIMEHLETKVNNMEKKTHTQLAQTYSLRTALKKFKDKGKEATMGEMKQLDDRNVYYPIKVDELTPKERKRAMESLLFVVEKRDGRVKARFCANGSTQREYMDRDETASPTVMTESIFITSVIDAK